MNIAEKITVHVRIEQAAKVGYSLDELAQLYPETAGMDRSEAIGWLMENWPRFAAAERAILDRADDECAYHRRDIALVFE